jgi:hypothetical protein
LAYGFWLENIFSECCSAGQTPQPPTRRTRVSLSVGPLTLILSGKGDPTSSYSTACIALGVITHFHSLNLSFRVAFVLTQPPKCHEFLH